MLQPEIKSSLAGANDLVTVTVWGDYVCPFCYLELPELERLKEELGDGLQVEWQPYELRPEPEPTLDPDGDYLHSVWNRHVYPMARERGLDLKLPPLQPRSRMAFEAAEFAKEQRRFDAVHRALFEAFFRDGRDIGSMEVLVDIVETAGLDGNQLRLAVETGKFTSNVTQSQWLARKLRIDGVPAALFRAWGKRAIVSGAQPYGALKAVVDELRA